LKDEKKGLEKELSAMRKQYKIAGEGFGVDLAKLGNDKLEAEKELSTTKAKLDEAITDSNHQRGKFLWEEIKSKALQAKLDQAVEWADDFFILGRDFIHTETRKGYTEFLQTIKETKETKPLDITLRSDGSSQSGIAPDIIFKPEKEADKMKISDLNITEKDSKKFPVKYGRDHHERITTGQMVEGLIKTMKTGNSEEANDYIDEEFLFGAWGEESKRIDPLMLRDIRGMFHEMYKQLTGMNKSVIDEIFAPFEKKQGD